MGGNWVRARRLHSLPFTAASSPLRCLERTLGVTVTQSVPKHKHDVAANEPRSWARLTVVKMPADSQPVCLLHVIPSKIPVGRVALTWPANRGVHIEGAEGSQGRAQTARTPGGLPPETVRPTRQE